MQSEKIDIEFVVENILFFPYTVYDEIMYILNQLECTSSINSTHITQLFKDIFTIEKPIPEPNQYPAQQPEQNYQNAYNHNPDPTYPNATYPNMNYPPNPNSFQENVIEDLEDIDLDNEEHFKKYEKNIHVNFNLLLSDTRNERLTNLTRSLRSMYLSTLLRTLLKEFYLLKDEKINDYSTNDSKTWERPVHRRQVRNSVPRVAWSIDSVFSTNFFLFLSDWKRPFERTLWLCEALHINSRIVAFKWWFVISWKTIAEWVEAI